MAEDHEVRTLLRNFALELLVYGALVVGYFFIVLRVLADPLARLFNSNLVAYALIALGLMVAQGVVLEAITSFLLEQLRLLESD